MEKNYILYAMLAVCAIIAVSSIISLNLYLILFDSILLLLSIALFAFSDIFHNLIIKHSNIIQVFNGYELSNDRSIAIFRSNGKVCALSAAMIDPSNVDELSKDKIEHLIGNMNYPFKLVMKTDKLDIKKIIDKLQTKKSMHEIAISRLNSNNSKHSLYINKLKREIEIIEHDIASISNGTVPIKLIYYVMTVAVADTVLEASERSKSQIKEIAAQFNVMLSSHSSILEGDDLIRLLEIDAMKVFN
ncbi:MAG: hypothetical protein ACP5RI_01740 [Candidatus Micrarchaeia archaeon]